jgi:hypothetical protein
MHELGDDEPLSSSSCKLLLLLLLMIGPQTPGKINIETSMVLQDSFTKMQYEEYIHEGMTIYYLNDKKVRRKLCALVEGATGVYI